MALIKCPECGKEISDKASSCPNCGCPLDSIQKSEGVENNNVIKDDKSKQKKEKKVIDPKKKYAAIICGVGVIIIGGVVYLATGKLRSYQFAENLLNQNKYQEAATCFSDLGDYKDSLDKYNLCQFSYANQLFENQDYALAAEIYNSLGKYENSEDQYKECCYIQAKQMFDNADYKAAKELIAGISDYKDCKEIISKCEYEMSVDGKFIKDLSQALMKRWDYDEDESKMKDDEFVSYRKELVNAELDLLSQYKDKKFNDTKLSKYANKYIDALNSQLKSLDYYSMNNNKYSDMWGEAYNERCLLIKRFYQDYGLVVEDSYKTILDSFITDAGVITEQANVEKQVKKLLDFEFDVVETSGNWKTYEAVVNNSTGETFEYFNIEVILYDKDNVQVGNHYTNDVSDWEPGTKVKFNFSTDESFESWKYIANYTVK